MRTAAAKPTQQYISLWKECKAAGFVPEQPSAADIITPASTIREILTRMEAIGSRLESTKEIDARTVSGIAVRRFWVVPGNEVPRCVHTESGDDIEHLCSIKFTL